MSDDTTYCKACKTKFDSVALLNAHYLRCVTKDAAKANSLSTLPPKSTATLEYYSGAPTGDPDSPTMHSASPTPPERTASPPTSPRNLLSRSTGSIVSLKREETPSPTPSDMIMNTDLQDVEALTAYNRDILDRGMEAKERKEELERMVEELREERWRAREREELTKGANFGGKGKGKGKQQ
jgi:hypothetical protein